MQKFKKSNSNVRVHITSCHSKVKSGKRSAQNLLNLLVDEPVPGVSRHISEVGWLIRLVIHGLRETLENFQWPVPHKERDCGDTVHWVLAGTVVLGDKHKSCKISDNFQLTMYSKGSQICNCIFCEIIFCV